MASDQLRPDSAPCLAVTLGDPAGIGPEIASAALRAPGVVRSARHLVLGPGALAPDGFPVETTKERALERLKSEPRVFLDTGGDPADWSPGSVQRSAGAASLAALRCGHELALAGDVDALVTGPVSKEALHLAGEQCEGQTELLGRWCEVERYQMSVFAAGFACLLLTRHLPLRRALDEITEDRVFDHLLLLIELLRGFGHAEPRIALAGLNPHAGEAGLLGSEDAELLRPAVERAREAGVHAVGPESPDALFLRAADGEFDGVLALYHDQAFLPMKILGRDVGVTVIAGLPYLRVSPIHGTAFGLVGRGLAKPGNLIRALELAAEWAPSWTARGSLTRSESGSRAKA